MNIADVMQELADQLDTIAGLRVYAFPPASVQPPAAVVTFPDTYTLDETYARGMDRLELPVVLMVGKVSDRASRDRLGVYVDGSGAKSVKQVLEAGTYTAMDTVRVASAVFDIVSMAGVEHLAATLSIDVTGQGA